jgi:hypothetical protein
MVQERVVRYKKLEIPRHPREAKKNYRLHPPEAERS